VGQVVGLGLGTAGSADGRAWIDVHGTAEPGGPPRAEHIYGRPRDGSAVRAWIPAQDQLSERELAELELGGSAAGEEERLELSPVQVAVLIESQQDGSFPSGQLIGQRGCATSG